VLTRVLVAINVIAYVWEKLTGALDSNAALEAHGGLLGTDVMAGEWWRIFTSAFLHGSEMHILFNMIALWQVGTFVELIFGTPRMALIYFFAMIGSGVAVTYLTPNDVTIGASGAIFGLFGALAVAGFRLGERGRDMMRQTTGIIVINLVIGFLPGLNISMAGHVGGLVVGTLCGLVLFRVPRPPVPVAQSEPAYAQRIAPYDDPGIETIEHQP
jgi:membrane associated rhomboid family serine protease